MGFLFDNKAHHQALEKYMVSVDSVEKVTGMDFFSKLPDNVERRYSGTAFRKVKAGRNFGSLLFLVFVFFNTKTIYRAMQRIKVRAVSYDLYCHPVIGF